MGSITRERIKRVLKKLEDSMAAAAFAEAGEFETAKGLLKERRKILLALTGKNSDTNAFKYAINICNRIKAGLEIFFIDDEFEKEQLDYYKSHLEREGIEYNMTKGKGCIKEELLKHTSNNREILFVIVESSDRLSINCKEKEEHIITESWKNLKCPLVVVSGMTGT